MRSLEQTDRYKLDKWLPRVQSGEEGAMGVTANVAFWGDENVLNIHHGCTTL